MAHDDLKCYQEYVPLMESWRRFREKGLLSGAWAADFRDFFNWAVANGYCPGTKVMRVDKKQPASPGNCYLILPDGEIGGVRGGYRNMPCTGCPNETPSGCVGYLDCKRYKAWLDKGFEDFREAARRKGWM